MIEKLIAILFNQARPAEFSRYRAYFVMRRLRPLISHLEKQQIRQLLDIIAVAHPVGAKDVTVVPELLHDCGRSHVSSPSLSERNHCVWISWSKNLFELGFQYGKVFSDGAPHGIQIDIKIGVDQAIAHARNILPRDRTAL